MSIGRTKEEQELNARIAQGLVVKEVLEPMSKIGWGHGTPPPPDYSGRPAAPAEGAPGQAAAPASAPASGQPAPAAPSPAPTGEPKADAPLTAERLVALYESLRDPETGLIMRKYKTPADAIQGSAHLAGMAKQAFSERDLALAELAKLNTTGLSARPAPAASPVAVPQPTLAPESSRTALDEAQARYDKVLSEIAENGGVLDADSAVKLGKAQREVTEAAADYRVQQNLNSRKTAEDKDRTEWDAVDRYMAENHPASARFADEVTLNMKSDPLLNAAVQALLAQGKKLEATLHAWKAFEAKNTAQIATEDRAKAEEKESDLRAKEQVRQEQLEKARRDAGVVQGSAGGTGTHEVNAARHSREEVSAAAEAMRREGDAPGSPAARRFRELVIPLDPSIFGPR